MSPRRRKNSPYSWHNYGCFKDKKFAEDIAKNLAHRRSDIQVVVSRGKMRMPLVDKNAEVVGSHMVSGYRVRWRKAKKGWARGYIE